MRALVIANGEPPSRELLQTLAAGAQLVVAADGGAAHALAAGLSVDAVVGDHDSVTPQTPHALPPDRFHEVANPDTNDLQKAISYCIAQGADSVDVVAAGGADEYSRAFYLRAIRLAD